MINAFFEIVVFGSALGLWRVDYGPLILFPGCFKLIKYPKRQCFSCSLDKRVC